MLFYKNRKDIMKIDEAKQTKREQLKQYAQKLKSLSEDEKTQLMKGLLIKNIEGRELSPTNQMLIIMQCQQATVVGGFNQWKQQGRKIKKGECGSVIFIPIRKNKEDESGNPLDDTQLSHFICGNVFDITQTEEIK
jgi:hypothetical protein